MECSQIVVARITTTYQANLGPRLGCFFPEEAKLQAHALTAQECLPSSLLPGMQAILTPQPPLV